MKKIINHLKNILSTKLNVVDNFDLESISYPSFMAIKSSQKIISSNKLFKERYCNVDSAIDVQDKASKFFEDKISLGCIVYSTEDVEINKQHLDESFAFYDSAPNASILIDYQGRVIRSNDAFIKMLGNEKYRHNGWLYSEIIEEGKELVTEAIDNILNNKTTIEAPLEIKIIGDKKIICLLQITKLTHHQLKEVLNLYFIDITEHKNLEMNFAHSQKMQALGQLAGGIAHDFNNLLTAMLGFSDILLMRHPAGDPSFSDIMQIRQNVNRATSLVRQLLAFSKKQILNIQISDANEILAELSSLINRLIGENIKLNISYERDLKAVKVDQGQLEQVIINLVVNARDSMIKGGELSIASKNIIINDDNRFYQKLFTPFVKETMEDGEYVLITVKDTGTGIPKKNLNMIFEPFFSTKDVGSGTGLGLSTVYGIIKQSNGYLFLDTKENMGTQFYIFLKAHEYEWQEQVQVSSVKDISTNLVDLSGDNTVLIVEDEAPVRAVSAHALKSRGYKVLEARDGLEAINIVKEMAGKIDLIISDVIMPSVNGPDMVKKIHQSYPSIKVIFISGYTEHASIDGIINNDKVSFLAKPFSLKQLSLKAKEALNAAH